MTTWWPTVRAWLDAADARALAWAAAAVVAAWALARACGWDDGGDDG